MTINETSILVPGALLRAHDQPIEKGQTVLVSGGKVVSIGTLEALKSERPDAQVIDLPDTILMPGFVNAHQHGRGISQIQLGYPDQRLELWMAERRGRGIPNLEAIGLLASAEMLKNGVTTVVHADLAYGSGDYAAELAASISGYDKAGLRATIAVGVCDQGNIVFPEGMAGEFLESLPTDLAAWLRKRDSAPYKDGLAGTSALLDALLDTHGDNKRINFCYGPSGPQWVTDSLFAEVARDAAKRNIGLHIHSLETVAQYEACRILCEGGTVRHLQKLGAVGPKTSFAHGVFLTDDDLNIMAAEGAMLATNPGSNLRLCDSVAPVREALAKGIRVGVGSDNSTVQDDEDLLSEARAASLLGGRKNWDSPPRPTGRQVLQMLTTHGAAVADFEGTVGRIDVGWHADIVAISTRSTVGAYLDSDMDIIDAMMSRAKGADVKLTMVAGRVLYQNGQFPHLDADKIQAAAGAAAQAARTSSDPDATRFTKELRPHIAKFYANLTAETRFKDRLS